MKITAALAWYAEPVELLEGCVLSLPGLADQLVAVGGRWEGFPAQHESEQEASALVEAAGIAGLEVQIFGHRAPFLFPSQSAKRTEMLRRAVETGCDWILVIDADEQIEACDHDLLEELLSDTPADVAEVQLRNAGPEVRNLTPRPARRLFRAAAWPAVGPAHNFVHSADGRWLAGDPAYVTLEPAVDASEAVAIVNEVGARPRTRQQAAELYYRARREPQPA